MTKPFKNLIKDMTPARRERIARRKKELYAEMALQELRQARELTQQQIASSLKLNQAAISKIEHQSDIYVSTLRRFLKALGGELRIVAHFPQGDIAINQFEDISKCRREKGLLPKST